MEIRPDLLKALKQYALDHDIHLWQATEKAVLGLVGQEGAESSIPRLISPDVELEPQTEECISLFRRAAAAHEPGWDRIREGVKTALRIVLGEHDVETGKVADRTRKIGSGRTRKATRIRSMPEPDSGGHSRKAG